ncbi:unnamed protein product, partial [Laminaria digitata]
VVRTALPAEGRTAGAGGGGDDAEEVATYVGGDFRRRVRAPAPTFVPDPPPERPVGGLGLFSDETVREYKRAYEDVIWPALEKDFGWTRVHGPRVNDAYFMPMGVVRGKNGAKCRVDYYDSFRQVVIHMVEREEKYRDLLEKAWAAAIVKPRPTGRRSNG